MTSELEKMAEEYGDSLYNIHNTLADDCRESFLAGAKAVLEFARYQACANWDTGHILVDLADLEKFIEGEK